MSVTREKIMELGEDLILNKGYNAFSYQDISSEMGIKNAAVHYYFPSKSSLGTSIVKNNIHRFEEMTDNMQIRELDEWQQLESFLKIYLRSNREQKICLMGSLGPDFNTLPEPTQNELARMTKIVIDWLTELLRIGKEKGSFDYKGEPRDRALVILSNMIGSLLLARILDKSEFKMIYHSVIEDLKP